MSSCPDGTTRRCHCSGRNQRVDVGAAWRRLLSGRMDGPRQLPPGVDALRPGVQQVFPAGFLQPRADQLSLPRARPACMDRVVEFLRSRPASPAGATAAQASSYRSAVPAELLRIVVGVEPLTELLVRSRVVERLGRRQNRRFGVSIVLLETGAQRLPFIEAHGVLKLRFYRSPAVAPPGQVASPSVTFPSGRPRRSGRERPVSGLDVGQCGHLLRGIRMPSNSSSTIARRPPGLSESYRLALYADWRRAQPEAAGCAKEADPVVEISTLR